MTANMITSPSNNHDRMKHPLVLGLLAILFVATPGLAQDQEPDPRIGLAGGFRDAGEAALNMNLVVNLPKPEGFYDPEAPGGRISRPRTPPEPEVDDEAEVSEAEETAEPTPPERPRTFGFNNSDIAFSDTHMFVGNYHGFNTYSLEDPQ